MNLSKFSNYKKTLAIMIILLFVGVSIQFTSPEIENPPVTGEIKAPAAVKSILERACYDCHSNETNLKWYDQIAPLSWKVASDIKEARSRYNFSAWDSIPKAQQNAWLWEIVNMAEQGRMPLKSYVVTHPSAKVTAADISILKKYLTSLPDGQQPDTAQIVKPVKKAEIHDQPEFAAGKIPVSLNGISYFPDYKKWKVISTTNKFDVLSIRVVYGNDIMVKALQEGKINPFPDGAKIVKVVWNQQPEDKDGNVKAANFVNAQFMIKDSRKFKDTEGWGFAKFSGLKLLPYGKTAKYGVACINCHRLVTDQGFVFDMPTKNRITNN